MAAAKTPQRARRRWSASEKCRIVELTLRGNASVRAVAHEHGVNRNSLYQWQALYRAGKLQPQPRTRARAGTSSATFLPVTMAPPVHAPRPAGDLGARCASIMQLTFSSGATLRIEADALDTGVVCALVAQLQR